MFAPDPPHDTSDTDSRPARVDKTRRGAAPMTTRERAAMKGTASGTTVIARHPMSEPLGRREGGKRTQSRGTLGGKAKTSKKAPGATRVGTVASRKIKRATGTKTGGGRKKATSPRAKPSHAKPKKNARGSRKAGGPKARSGSGKAGGKRGR